MERGSSSKNILKLPILVANSTNSCFRHNSLIPKFQLQWVGLELKIHIPMLNLNLITVRLCFEKYLFYNTNNYWHNCIIWRQTFVKSSCYWELGNVRPKYTFFAFQLYHPMSKEGPSLWAPPPLVILFSFLLSKLYKNLYKKTLSYNYWKA